MCNQKLISNKFDLKQTTRVLHTGGQRFWRTPLRNQVWQEVNKQYHGLTTLKLQTATTTLPFEKTEECKSTTKNGELQEQEFVLLL